MAHYAQINEDNIVEQVLVIDNSEEDGAVQFLENTFGMRWVKTSYNTMFGQHILGGVPFRKNYAGIGYYFDENRDAFIPPKAFPSWILDEETCTWVSPTPYPKDGAYYRWNESTLSWDLFDF
jgi:hypothetical protein